MKVNTKPRNQKPPRDEDSLFYQEMTGKDVTQKDKQAIRRKEEYIKKHNLNQ